MTSPWLPDYFEATFATKTLTIDRKWLAAFRKSVCYHKQSREPPGNFWLTGNYFLLGILISCPDPLR